MSDDREALAAMVRAEAEVAAHADGLAPGDAHYDTYIEAYADEWARIAKGGHVPPDPVEEALARRDERRAEGRRQEVRKGVDQLNDAIDRLMADEGLDHEAASAKAVDEVYGAAHHQTVEHLRRIAEERGRVDDAIRRSPVAKAAAQDAYRCLIKSIQAEAGRRPHHRLRARRQGRPRAGEVGR